MAVIDLERCAQPDLERVVAPFAPSETSDHANFESMVSIMERAGDLVGAMASGALAYQLYWYSGIGKHLHYPSGTVSLAALLFGILFVVMLQQDGAYEDSNSLLRIKETERILRVSVQTFGLLFPITFFFSHQFSRWVIAFALVLTPAILIIEKQLLLALFRYLHGRGYGVQNVLVYGAGSTGRSIFSALVRSPKLGFKPVAIIDDDIRLEGQEIYEYGYRRKESVSVISGPLTTELIRSHGARLIVMGVPSMTPADHERVLQQAFAAKASVAFVPQTGLGVDALTDYLDLDGVLLISMAHQSTKRWYGAAKRAFDFVSSLILCICTAPIWILIAVLIRMDSNGPIFFRQSRVGRSGREFNLYKFRSMRTDAPVYGLHPTSADDPRVTSIGKWLRRSGLDELPQLINILQGDMSLVGPRPEMPFIVDGYSKHHQQRLSVVPGLTGLWQISADRAFQIHENIQYDLYYIRHRNFFMDLAILLHTAVFAMKGV